MAEGARTLDSFPIHLGLGATAEAQPEFPADERAMDWYMAYGERHAADGAEGRLVSCFRFAEDWTSWEMHPSGDEVVVCLEGAMTLIQDLAGEHVRTALGPGEYAINKAGTWHTADVAAAATALFITSGLGTEHRPR
ncbi:MAG: cupin [Sphingomonadales bacterium 32-68-7]|nr:MAG: cupin [Sphingomonadales bacterium 12-68-11]OYX08246.1 MAG: cupin [Sphingomonadales bacterium 32-68-7]